MVKNIRFLLIVVLLTGCAHTVVLPVDSSLTHEEVVSRLKVLFKKQTVLPLSLFESSEKRISPTRTRLRYVDYLNRGMLPSLVTTAWYTDWSELYVETAKANQVEIWVKSYRLGNFIDSRQYETEEAIAKRLLLLKNRTNNYLEPMP